MRRPYRALLACAVLALVATGGIGPTAAAPVPAGEGVVVELDQSEVVAGPGEKISFESTIRNDGEASLEGYVAHLNILTTDAGVYVDPEDWSPERTQYLGDLAPGEAATLDWNVQAVTSGPLILFVSVTSPTSETVTSSGPLDLTVEGQRVVDSAGVMPLVLWMPAGVLALLGASLLRRRRHR
jgi:hypothetical protein